MSIIAKDFPTGNNRLVSYHLGGASTSGLELPEPARHHVPSQRENKCSDRLMWFWPWPCAWEQHRSNQPHRWNRKSGPSKEKGRWHVHRLSKNNRYSLGTNSHSFTQWAFVYKVQSWQWECYWTKQNPWSLYFRGGNKNTDVDKFMLKLQMVFFHEADHQGTVRENAEKTVLK